MKNLLSLTAAFVVAVCLSSPSFAADKNNADQSTPTTAKTAPTKVEPSATKVAHDGSIDDIDAIGNRNVGCARGMGNWYSLERQIALGKQVSMQVETQSKIINDPVVTEYINRLGQNIVRNSDSQVPFTIKVIDSDDINAFALPGGFFYVNSGLILAADEEAVAAHKYVGWLPPQRRVTCRADHRPRADASSARRSPRTSLRTASRRRSRRRNGRPRRQARPRDPHRAATSLR